MISLSITWVHNIFMHIKLLVLVTSGRPLRNISKHCTLKFFRDHITDVRFCLLQLNGDIIFTWVTRVECNVFQMEESTESLTSRYADAILPLTICLGVLMVFGILGNIVVLCVYLPRPRKKEDRNNYRIFTINFAILDLFVCAVLFPTDMIRQRTEFNFHSEGLCMIKNYINNYGAVACALSLMIISIDRTRKVLHPMKIQMSKSLAIRLCVGLSLFSLIVNVPVAVTSSIQETNKTNIFGNQTLVYVCGVNKEYKEHFLLLITKIFDVFLVGAVSVSTTIMYVIIFCVYHTRNKSGILRRSIRYSSSYQSGYRRRKATQNNCAQQTNSEEKSSIDGSGLSSSLDIAPSPTAYELTSRASVDTHHSGYFPRMFPVKTCVWATLTFIFVVTHVVSLALAYYMGSKDVLKQQMNDLSSLQREMYNIKLRTSSTTYALLISFRKLYYVNSIVNPVIYFILDQTFRKASISIMRYMSRYIISEDNS